MKVKYCGQLACYVCGSWRQITTQADGDQFSARHVPHAPEAAVTHRGEICGLDNSVIHAVRALGAPSVREISAYLGWPSSTVYTRIARLQELEFVTEIASRPKRY